MKKFIIFALTFAAILFSGCASTTQGGVVGADRSQFFMVSEAQMDQGAALAYTQTIDKAKKSNTLNTNHAQTKRVRAISSRLIDQVGVFRQDAAKWNWQVNVINENTINAWCMPGGRIVVYSGIINQLKLNDAELAAIIGHEMAHALREHGREQASSEQLKSIGIMAVGIATGSNDLANLANMAAHYTISLPFSRGHETEADLIGLELMARAGYNPNAAITLWEKMDKASESKPLEFLSTHPSNESRISELKAKIDKVMPLYEKK
ncbi:M48 family metallopeptidase [Campylobacter geochelonis]|uniref:Peptidase M48, Ste24p n=1 Tax=Campylobacter geochelonis TaxID=1780362 RepID=A0A128ELD0_9BACT|nr:M48 family metallopeptidase [Campylobacter geochelonis]QKF72148.1 peptidase, M48 family [Campylobacter geochelonis]CZE45992.1 peptidase M48%2C Ste24p [Campylobacter geochelonis]CZE46630.1 peptidase M48%2C Ste24p [Campylobacter geochelonis]CZE49768.1 peptidase M48%2C Ste24p [Campylobacter geochelonis]